MNKVSLKFRETGRTFKYFYAENVNNKASKTRKYWKQSILLVNGGLEVALQTLKHLLAVIHFPLPKQK